MNVISSEDEESMMRNATSREHAPEGIGNAVWTTEVLLEACDRNSGGKFPLAVRTRCGPNTFSKLKHAGISVQITIGTKRGPLLTSSGFAASSSPAAPSH